MGSVTKGGNQKENLGFFVFVCWQIWKARNDWVFNKKWIGEQEILGYGTNEFHDFVAATSKTREPRQPMEETISKWNPSNHGVVKINSDGAFDGSGKKGSVGLVARDYLGQVKWVTAIPLSNTHSAEAVEALGFRWAVTLAKEKGGKRFSFEGDAQFIIQMLKGEKAISSSLAVIIRDIIRLSTSFCDFSFTPQFKKQEKEAGKIFSPIQEAQTTDPAMTRSASTAVLKLPFDLSATTLIFLLKSSDINPPFLLRTTTETVASQLKSSVANSIIESGAPVIVSSWNTNTNFLDRTILANSPSMFPFKPTIFLHGFKYSPQYTWRGALRWLGDT
ncbi:hypothetical protein Vadar_016730 [Vaccinium darrowii]|uniref:Uncharacterized protein n=1 Tax=Vaccinium darrowii TaxID=229202 RepID=A0ACB7ZKP4_9ERIC|nr:hypothetical protein Vadar_016730 [Vaccinium darrowii]